MYSAERTAELEQDDASSDPYIHREPLVIRQRICALSDSSAAALAGDSVMQASCLPVGDNSEGRRDRDGDLEATAYMLST